MSNLRQAAKQALEALMWHDEGMRTRADSEAITALRAALAEPVQEPIGYWQGEFRNTESRIYRVPQREIFGFKCPNIPIYTHPSPHAPLAKPNITITGTYEEFIEFVHMACLHETIYDDSEGRQILVLRMLDAYGMAHSWALEHTRNNLS